MFRESCPPLPSLKRLSISVSDGSALQVINHLGPYRAIEELAFTVMSSAPMATSQKYKAIDCLSRTKTLDGEFLPSLRQIWLEASSTDWAAHEGVLLAGATRRLLSNRPNVYFQLHVYSLEGISLCHSDLPDLEVLCRQFSSRITATLSERQDFLPNWPQAWDSDYF